MDYSQTVEYLYHQVPSFERTGQSGYKEGLTNTLLLDQHFGHPHQAYKTIHIAGTNGKGSCAHTLAAMLQEAGYKVGLYTSPHLIDFRERIKINGQPISRQRVVDFVQQNRKFFEPLQPSFFELTTALAFLYFKEQNVDFAVIEVGLGGRLDCTNIIHPILDVITNISFDHMQMLGNTLPKLASDKAGIIKQGVPVIIGESNSLTRPVFEAKAKEKGATIDFAQDNPMVLSSTPDNQRGGRNYETTNMGQLYGQLSGDCQERNTNTILHAVKQLQKLGIVISEEEQRRAFAHVCNLTGLMGRWQTLQSQPLVICDIGHNEGCFQYIAPQLATIKSKVSRGQLRMVFGMVSDKDIDAVLRLLPTDALYYFTQANIRRAETAEHLAIKAATYNIIGKKYLNVPLAYQAALSESQPQDIIFVGGSSYIVSDLLTYLSNPE